MHSIKALRTLLPLKMLCQSRSRFHAHESVCDYLIEMVTIVQLRLHTIQ